MALFFFFFCVVVAHMAQTQKPKITGGKLFALSVSHYNTLSTQQCFNHLPARKHTAITQNDAERSLMVYNCTDMKRHHGTYQPS